MSCNLNHLARGPVELSRILLPQRITTFTFEMTSQMTPAGSFHLSPREQLRQESLDRTMAGFQSCAETSVRDIRPNLAVFFCDPLPSYRERQRQFYPVLDNLCRKRG